MPERRREVRVEVASDEHVVIALTHRVRLLDISLSGALIACDVKLPVGARGRFSIALAADRFVADVTVARHHHGAVQKHAAGLGAIFSSMDESSRRGLEQFLRRASEPA